MSSKEAAHHVLPLKVYIGVWLGLIVGTILTVAVSYFDFGEFNMIVAMAIATGKAALVALFFMHLYWDDKINLVLFIATLMFVGIFFAFTSADVFTRGELDPIKQNYVKPMPPMPTEGNLHPNAHPPEGAEHGAKE